MKTIKCKLDSSELERAIEELRDYREDFEKKIERFVRDLVSAGVVVANMRVSSTQGDSSLPTVTYEVDSRGDIVSANIAINGGDVLFVEFGAGIAYNTGAEHPKASEFGYGIGTYPSEHPPNKAINPGYWYYGHGKRSIGTQASMPIYGASESMRNELIQKAVEAFRS